jgi:hypothetical protein
MELQWTRHGPVQETLQVEPSLQVTELLLPTVTAQVAAFAQL